MQPNHILDDLHTRFGWDLRRQGFTSVYQHGNIHLEFVREPAAASGYAVRTWVWTRSRKTEPQTMLLDEDNARLAADAVNVQLNAAKLLDEIS